MTTYAVIMAGGAGTRFWPASREKTPKQLLALSNDPNETLLASTVRRIASWAPNERVYIATGLHLVDATKATVPGIPNEQVLAEPVPRNTAPCIGWATATIARRDPEAVIAVLPSDHFIGDEASFSQVIARALNCARSGFLTTIGVVPTRAETGYGYIEVGEARGDGAHAVSRFVEKPPRDVAEKYLEGGRHLWNAGMFFFRADVMLQAIREHLPALAIGLEKLDRAFANGTEQAEIASIFPELPSISIDHGVMEKASNLAVVPGSFAWNDVGSWQSAWELATRNVDGNALPEGAIAVDARNNLVRDLTTHGGKKLVALVGVSDLVVVETDDSLLIIPRSRAQDVRAVVEELKARGDRARL